MDDPKREHLLTPLRRAERMLGARSLHLERHLPLDGGEDPRWDDYKGVVALLLGVRAIELLAGISYQLRSTYRPDERVASGRGRT